MNPCHYYPYQSIPHPSFIGNPHHASAYQPSPCYTSYPLQQSQQVRPPVDSKDRTASNTKSSEHINLIRDLLQELKVAKEDASKANQQVVKLLHSLTIASGANSSLGHKGRHDGGSREQSVQTDVPSAMTTERCDFANIVNLA